MDERLLDQANELADISVQQKRTPIDAYILQCHKHEPLINHGYYVDTRASFSGLTDHDPLTQDNWQTSLRAGQWRNYFRSDKLHPPTVLP